MCDKLYIVARDSDGTEFTVGISQELPTPSNPEPQKSNPIFEKIFSTAVGYEDDFIYHVKKGVKFTLSGPFADDGCFTVVSVLSTCNQPDNFPNYADIYDFDDSTVDPANLDLDACYCELVTDIEPCVVFKDCKTIIHEHFAGASFEVFNANRYGIKSCKVKHDPYFLHDLLMLQKVTSEIEACNDNQVLSCDCDYDKICERINTL